MDEASMEEKIDKALSVAKGIVFSRTESDDVQKVAQSVLNLSHVKASWDGDGSTEMDKELSFVLGKIRSNLNATALVQFTQAALHLATARSVLIGKPKPKKLGASAS